MPSLDRNPVRKCTLRRWRTAGRGGAAVLSWLTVGCIAVEDSRRSPRVSQTRPCAVLGVVGMCELLMVSLGSVAWRRQALCGRYSPKLGSLGVRSLLPAAPVKGGVGDVVLSPKQ